MILHLEKANLSARRMRAIHELVEEFETRLQRILEDEKIKISFEFYVDTTVFYDKEAAEEYFRKRGKRTINFSVMIGGEEEEFAARIGHTYFYDDIMFVIELLPGIPPLSFQRGVSSKYRPVNLLFNKGKREWIAVIKEGPFVENGYLSSCPCFKSID